MSDAQYRLLARRANDELEEVTHSRPARAMAMFGQSRSSAWCSSQACRAADRLANSLPEVDRLPTPSKEAELQITVQRCPWLVRISFPSVCLPGGAADHHSRRHQRASASAHRYPVSAW